MLDKICKTKHGVDNKAAYSAEEFVGSVWLNIKSIYDLKESQGTRTDNGESR